MAALSSSPTPLAGEVKVAVSGAGAPALTFCTWFRLAAVPMPSRAYTKLDGDSVVVVVGSPCRSYAPGTAGMGAVPSLKPVALTVTVAVTVSVTRPSSPWT